MATPRVADTGTHPDGRESKVFDTDNQLSPERAQQISIESQVRKVVPLVKINGNGADLPTFPNASDVVDINGLPVEERGPMIPKGAGTGYLPLLDGSLDKSTLGAITDCQKGECIVGGEKYSKSTDIPRNRPQPLLHTDGSPVLGPNGQPVSGPERANLDELGSALKLIERVSGKPAAIALAKLNFRHEGYWDFQRMQADGIPSIGIRTIYTDKYKDFANIAVGYALGSLGLKPDEIAGIANDYCGGGNCHFREPMSKEYPNIPERLVQEYRTGVNLYQERRQAGLVE